MHTTRVRLKRSAPQHLSPSASAARTTVVEGSTGRLATAVVAAVTLISLGTLAVTGQPLLAALPMLAVACVYATWALPMRVVVLPLVFAQCLFFAPFPNEQWIPYASGPLWQYFIKPGDQFMNVYLNKVVGVSVLSLTGQELLYALLLLLLVVRLVRRDRIDLEGNVPVARIVFVFLAVQLAATVALEVLGAAKGGNMRSSLFQLRTVLWLPLETVVLSYALRTSQDFRKIAIAVTVAASAKIAAGLYFLIHDAWRQGVESPYMTGHQDTVLFVAVLFFWMAAWMHERGTQRLIGMLLVVSWMLVGIYVNNRRLAYVSIVATLLAFYPLISGLLKRRIKFFALATSPLLVVYLLLARTHTTGIFGPGAELMGIANVADASTQWREMENFDLIFTLQQQRLFGSGWGHEFIELIALPAVSDAYPQYRLVAHNTVLWLLSISGAVGFMFLWMPVVLAIFLAARSYHHARKPVEQTAAASALAIVVCYVSQAWGDLGMAAPVPTLLLAGALAVAGKLATETNAWPSGTRLFKSNRLRADAAGLRPEAK